MSQLSPSLLAILACPKCRGTLEAEQEALRCDACGLRYRVEDGIPHLLIDQADPVASPPSSGA